ncbi:hypothetical protein KSS87_012653 [Heliosperma pusillum]|nr:hypothetical protein KSS87_012653 [Heliosperma pusillum]
MTYLVNNTQSDLTHIYSLLFIITIPLPSPFLFW